MKLCWVGCSIKITVVMAVVVTTLSLRVPAVGYRESGYGLSEIFVPQTSTLSDPNHPFGASVAFDLSPDGKTLAVEFGTREPDKRITDWVALWDVESQHLITTKEVEQDEPRQTLSSSFSRNAVRTKLPEGLLKSNSRFNIHSRCEEGLNGSTAREAMHRTAGGID
jgi:hypothetical protein